jgi:hypothetical protein
VAWYPGVRREQTPNRGDGTLDPIAVVCHRTYGFPAGDLAVMRGSRAPIGFHFLVLPDGLLLQGASTTARCNHAAGANDWTIGIEVSSRSNEIPMTPAQIHTLGRLCGWISRTHSIPLRYFVEKKREGRRAGFIPHWGIAGSNHGDGWSANEWSRIVAASGETAADRTGVSSTEDTQGDALMAMIVWEHDRQLHTFDVQDHNLMHRWFDLRANRWTSEVLAGPKAPSSMWREPVKNPQVSVARYNSGLHVTAGEVHAWFHPSSRRWQSERLP